MTSDEPGFAARGEVDIACRVVTSSGDTPELSATRCRACGGRIEATIVSGPVLRRRRRLIALGGDRSRLRGETCIDCGLTDVFAEDTGGIFPDSVHEESQRR